MSNPEDDADKIRLKRLARLHSQTTSSSSTRTVSQSKPPTAKINDSVALNVETKSESRPPSSLPPASPASPAVVSAPLGSQNRIVGTGVPPRPWEDRILSQIFKVTLQPGAKANEVRYLEKLRSELEDEGEQPFLTTRNLDQLILTMADRGPASFDYLVSCWKRASVAFRSPKLTMDDHKVFVLKEAKRMCISYAIYHITIPDMFENLTTPLDLESKLLVDPEDDNGISLEFLKELMDRSDEEPALKDAFSSAIAGLSTRLSLLDMSSEYKPYISALQRIVSNTHLANLLIQNPSFLPTNISASSMEQRTILGPYFRLSPLQMSVIDIYFTNSKTKPVNSVMDATRALRLTLQTIQDQLLQIVNALLRVSTEARDRVLDYFAKVMNLNHKRTALQTEPGTVASDAFMLNITSILTRLCEPFMDTAYSKLSKVDVKYFRQNSRLDISSETKINANAQTSTNYYSQKLDGAPNFISSLFFLTVAAHHYGLGATEQNHRQLRKDIEDMERNLEHLTEQRAKWLNSPELPLYDRQLERLRDRIDKGIAYELGLEVLLYDPQAQARTLHFIRFLTAWLLRLVQPSHNYPQQRLRLPLPETVPDEFTYLPEYFVEIIGSCFHFVLRVLPHLIIGTQVEELVTFCITFLRMSSYIHNPYLKSKLVEILYYGIQPNRSKANGCLGDAINSNGFALENLMHSLMNFYIDIESQYYHKFTVRWHISQIIQRMWDNPAYRGKLEQESRLNEEFFIRFVALLLNDVTYVMDHSLTALLDIHKYQHELEGADASSSPQLTPQERPPELTPQERTEKEKALARAERDASSYTNLANETVLMLKLFTATLADAFVRPEIVHRLAGMLDYNLDALTGPRCSNLRVKEPEKYGFRPRVLVGYIAEVYLNLRKKRAFLEAIAKDGRSYTPELFVRFQRILGKYELKSQVEREELEEMAAQVEKIKQAEDEEELELGDIPDEFLDPLMATLMVDPVILPSSRVTIDRQTIRAHLLSDAKDPFNRASLKEEDVIPDTDLKARIDAFVAERRGMKAGNQMEIDS